MNKIITTILTLLCFATTVQANPVVVVITGGFSVPESSALLGESIVIVLLLAHKKFKLVRTMFIWPLITLLTYWVFLFGYFMSSSDVIGITILEILVVLGEAWIIYGLSKTKFSRKPDEPISKKHALLISAAGNLTSVAIGLLWGFKL